jgi:hypothetical protein
MGQGASPQSLTFTSPNASFSMQRVQCLTAKKALMAFVGTSNL